MAFDFFSYDIYLKNVFLDNAQKKYTLEAGEQYFAPDDKYIYLLNQGIIKVYVNDMEGNERLLWLLREGCVIPTFHAKKLNISKQIQVVKTCELLMITKESFFSLGAAIPDFFLKFMDQIYERYEGLIENFINDSNLFCKVRFYRLLYEIAVTSSVKLERGIILDDYLSRQDMASLIGTHTTNISKYLLELEKLGVLQRLSGKRILVIDLEYLEKMISELEEQRLR